jgi:glycosyltransferase involved in cell wall biosynthesis
MNISLSIVVPAYNEGRTIYSSAREIATQIELIEGAWLLIVNDGSIDETLSEVKKLERVNSRVRVLDLQLNGGYGAAILEGYRFASQYSTHVLYMDSDLTNSPQDIHKFYKALVDGYDYVKANRFSPGGGMSNVPAMRKVHSILGALIARYMMNKRIADPTNGFRAIKVGLIDYNSITAKGFSFILEELHLISKIKDLRVLNIPVVLGSRNDGQKTTAFVYDFRTYYSYLKPCFISFYERIKNGLHL